MVGRWVIRVKLNRPQKFFFRGGAVPVETDYEVDIFTGDVAIRLEQITWEGLGKKVAASLREVGDKTAHEPIPEPTPAAMSSIDARCGETPPEGTTIP